MQLMSPDVVCKASPRPQKSVVVKGYKDLNKGENNGVLSLYVKYTCVCTCILVAMIL